MSSSRLFVLWSLVCAGGLAAQGELQAPREFRVGSAIVRAVGGTDAVSRDGGASWTPLRTFDPQLHLILGDVDPLRAPPKLLKELAAPAGTQLFALQCGTQILPEYHAAIEAAAVQILGYLPECGYVVRGERAAVESLRAQPFVRWLGELPLAWKLPAALHGMVGERDAVGEPLAYNVLLACKTDEPRLVEQLRALGGAVEVHGPVLARVRLTPVQLRAAAALDTALWIEVAGRPAVDMDNARIQGGADYVETVAGMTGQGVRGEISEGFEQSHIDFSGMTWLNHYDGLDAHGHCTAGIVFGQGFSNPGARGMLPSGTMSEADYATWNTVTTRYNVVQEAADPARAFRAMFQTASWGDDPRVQVYNTSSVEIDRAIFDADIPLTQSQSNAGTRDSRAQAWAKNVISVGGVFHHNNALAGDDNWGGGGSIGPASDGRIKPDLCAYYDSVLTSDLSGAQGYALGDYFSGFNGTSAATPIVAGHLGLLLQMYTDGAFGNPLPLPATAANRFDNKPHFSTSKALLLNTTTQYPFSGANHDLTRVHQGWGFPNVQTAWDQRDKLLLVDEYFHLQQGQSRNQFVWVAPGTPELRVTMVYPDPPALPLAAVHRINSVDLKVTQFGTANFWWGNNGLLNGTASTTGGTPNDLDTVEQVVVPNPAPGLYIVNVSAPVIVQDGHIETPVLDVDYALAVRPMGGGYHGGSFELSATSLGPGDVTMTCTNAPTTGWTQGFTFLSLNTSLPAGFGRFFGLEDDFLFGSIFGMPETVGDVFHFPNAPGNYPHQPYSFFPPLVLGLSGLRFDAITLLFDANFALAGISNTSRCTIQ